MTVKQQLDDLVQALPKINEDRNYWLIRTQSGTFYQTFLDNKFVALGYDNISYSDISRLKRESAANEGMFIDNLRSKVREAYPEELRPGLIAGQISKFVYGLKANDIVLIPSGNSQEIAFGRVVETPVFIASDDEIVRTECEFILRKKIEWVEVFSRKSLDPYLYKVLFAHQAINNLNDYGEEIERSINDFFVKGDEAHIVLEVRTTDDIHARDLFNLGSGYLDLLEEVSNHFQLGVDADAIEVKMTLNSPGKIHFKAPSWKTITLFGVIIIAVNGGGLKLGGKTWSFDLSTDGIIKNVSEYLNQEHDRQVQDRIMDKYTDSLKIDVPADLVDVLQQTNTNKRQHQLPPASDTTTDQVE